MTPESVTPPGADRAGAAALPSALLSALGALVPALVQRDGDALTVKDATGAYVHADAGFLDWLGLGRGAQVLEHLVGHHPLPPGAQQRQGAIEVKNRVPQPAGRG